MATGRPSKHTPEVERAILDGLAEGKALRDVCQSIPNGPSAVTVRAWVAADPEFQAAYARSRAAGAAVHAEAVVSIADGVTDGTMEQINAARLRIDARKWYAAKVAPREYGDRSALEVSGPDGGAVRVESLVDLVRLAAKPDGPKGGAA
jgi:hypothetical protein